MYDIRAFDPGLRHLDEDVSAAMALKTSESIWSKRIMKDVTVESEKDVFLKTL